MTVRILGAFLIFIGCSGFGFLLSAAYKREVVTLKSLIEALYIMESELLYRKTPLPQLCHYISVMQTGVIKTYFICLENELQQQIQPDASSCAVLALSKIPQMPKSSKEIIQQVAKTIGEFDIHGQLTGIQAVRSEAQLRLDQMRKEQEQRTKNYRTLGVCAGAAIIILFV